MHTVIFGADAYRAFKQQKDYLLNKIVKPYGVSVEAAFRRIEILTSLLVYFPPTSSRGKPATAEQWKDFEERKKIGTDIKREMKYNLLPESYHDSFDELEVDWSEMTNSKFLAEAQKCESADKKNRLMKEIPKKRNAEEDSKSNLTRPQRDRNGRNKRQRENQQVTSAGKAREYKLCKMAGAPDFVYKSHFTNQCRKRGDYQKALSGGAAERHKTKNEYRSMEKELLRELKLLKKVKKLRKETLRSRPKKDKESSASEGEMSE